MHISFVWVVLLKVILFFIWTADSQGRRKEKEEICPSWRSTFCTVYISWTESSAINALSKPFSKNEIRFSELDGLAAIRGGAACHSRPDLLSIIAPKVHGIITISRKVYPVHVHIR